MQNSNGIDEPTDEMGFHGKSKWSRVKVGKLSICTEDEFIEIINSDSHKLHQIVLTIR